MWRVLLLLLFVLQLPARASQIAVGIWSKSLLAWNVWEQDQQQLTHRLLLHSSASQDVTVEIRRLRFTEVNYQFQTVPTQKVLFRVKLRPGQLLQLKYPKPGAGHDYMEFFENGQRVGVLEINGRPPEAPILADGLRFYTNTGANAGPLGYWLGFESLYAGPSRLAIFRPKGYEEEYQLLKILPGPDTLARRPANLDSLLVVDTSILRLDNRTAHAVVVRPGLPATALTLLTLETQYVSDSYYYDEQKVRHPRKETGGGARHYIPVFAQPRP